LYERALKNAQQIDDKDTHNSQCYAGIARTAVKLGDVARGF